MSLLTGIFLIKATFFKIFLIITNKVNLILLTIKMNLFHILLILILFTFKQTKKRLFSLLSLVAGVGLEPTTSGLWARRASIYSTPRCTNILYYFIIYLSTPKTSFVLILFQYYCTWPFIYKVYFHHCTKYTCLYINFFW